MSAEHSLRTLVQRPCRSRPLALAACLGWLAIAGSGHALSKAPLVLATFDGGTVTPRDLLAYPPATSIAEIPRWVERRTIDAADQRILQALAEEQGLLSDPALGLRARANVAVELAFRQVGRTCLSSGSKDPAAGGRRWIDIQRILVRVHGAGAAPRSEARRGLEGAVDALRRGMEVTKAVERHAVAGEIVTSRIYPDSALDPVLLRTAEGLADSEVSDVLRTRDGFEVVYRDSSGVDPAPRFRRASARLTQTVRVLRASVCPEALHRAELRIARGGFSAEGLRDIQGVGPRFTEEALADASLAGLDDANGSDSVAALPEDLLLAFRLAAGSVSERTRQRLDEAELRRLAGNATLRRERLRLALLAGVAPATPVSDIGFPASRSAESERTTRRRDRDILAKLREERHFSLDRQALELYAATLRP